MFTLCLEINRKILDAIEHKVSYMLRNWITIFRFFHDCFCLFFQLMENDHINATLPNFVDSGGWNWFWHTKGQLVYDDVI